MNETIREIIQSNQTFTPREAVADALQRFPDCKYADWDNGMSFPFHITIVVKMWRNEDCYLNDDPPKRVVEGYEPSRNEEGKML